MPKGQYLRLSSDPHAWTCLCTYHVNTTTHTHSHYKPRHRTLEKCYVSASHGQDILLGCLMRRVGFRRNWTGQIPGPEGKTCGSSYSGNRSSHLNSSCLHSEFKGQLGQLRRTLLPSIQRGCRAGV